MSWLAVLPYVFQIIAFVLGRVDANQKMLDAFQALIEASHDNGKITVDTKDKFLNQKAALEARLQSKGMA